MKLSKGWMELELVTTGTLSKEPIQKYGKVIAHNPHVAVDYATDDEYEGMSFLGMWVSLDKDYQCVNGRFFAEDSDVIAYEYED